MKEGFTKTKYEKRKKFETFDRRSFRRFLTKEEKNKAKPAPKKKTKKKASKKKVVKNLVKEPEVIEPDTQAPPTPPGRDASGVDKDVFWKQINDWRHKQAKEDYQLAEGIRTQVKLMLNNSLSKDPDSEKISTTMKPAHLRMLAQVAETVQKIQRLALGLSTENIGVESNVKTEEETGDNIPIFEIQMTEEGRFKNIRPPLLSSTKK